MRRYVELVNIFIFVIFCFQVSSCKKITSETKVTGGLDAENKLWALGVVRIVSVYPIFDKNGQQKYGSCTASIVSHNTLLTAAHCVTKRDSNNVLKEAERVYVYYKTSVDQSDFERREAHSFSWDKEHFIYDFSNVGKSGLYDVALIKFQNNTFSDITPLSIAPYTVDVGSSVISIGYGCLTDYINKNGRWYVECKETDSSSLKRWGYTKIAKNEYCIPGTIQVNQQTTTVDTYDTKPDGVDVATNHGDSGGPLLEHIDGDWYIGGVVSYSDHTYYKYKGKQSCYSNFRNTTSFTFLYHASRTLESTFPGINISVGVIELAGRVRVVEKQYDNLYTKPIQNSPFTVFSLVSGDKQCQTISSSDDLITCWNKLNLKEKTLTKWN